MVNGSGHVNKDMRSSAVVALLFPVDVVALPPDVAHDEEQAVWMSSA